MKSRLSFVLRSASISLAMAACHFSIQAQTAPATAEPSIFESFGLYVGVFAIIVLVAFVVLRRKNEAEAAQEAAAPKKNSGDGIKLTYSERPAAATPKQEPTRPAAPIKSTPDSFPVFSISKLLRTNYFVQLPESRDPALLQAIDITNEDSEAEAAERTHALRLLSTFKTSNSVAAIAQMALYDLSTKLRSDAVTFLAELDHESVFESIVTACADPTREVRAAGAKALFRLTFDRSHAWARIIESGDMSRMKHAARCAIEGEIVERSFDWLVHTDRKMAYEAFALTALLIRAGETEPIFKALASHRNENVKLALLHVLETIKEDQTSEDLNNLLLRVILSPKVAAKANEVRSCLQLVDA